VGNRNAKKLAFPQLQTLAQKLRHRSLNKKKKKQTILGGKGRRDEEGIRVYGKPGDVVVKGDARRL